MYFKHQKKNKRHIHSLTQKFYFQEFSQKKQSPDTQGGIVAKRLITV